MKNLIKAAKELNEVLGLDPEIKTDGVKKEVLERKLKEASTMIEPEDNVSEETIQTLEAFGAMQKAEPEEPKEAEEADKPEEEAPAKESETDLVAEIDKASKIKELKVLIKEHDEFKSLRSTVNVKFSVSELKEEMMELLGEPVEKVEETPAEEKPAKKKPKTGRTKKAVVQEMIAAKKGATIEQIAQAITDEGIDSDYKKNCRVVKLWLSKMGFDVKKAAIQANPYFKSK